MMKININIHVYLRRSSCIKRGRSSTMTIINKTEIIDDRRQGNHQCVERTSTWGTSIIKNDHHQTEIVG